MPSLQDLRRRIKSVKSIQQITSAMNMVATSRLRRAKDAANQNKPYAERMNEVVCHLAGHISDSFKHPLVNKHEGGKRLIVVVTSDKGLAGAYSSNVCKEALKSIPDKSQVEIVAVGRKAKDYFKSRGYTIAAEFSGFSEKPTYHHAADISSTVIKSFTEGGYQDVILIYTKFISAITFIPQTVQLLPVKLSFDNPEEASKHSGAADNSPHSLYIFEPTPEEVLGSILPEYIASTIFTGLLQAAASELSSRMNAMSNATDNAGELIASLDLYYNKVRQAGITNEISEIVGGAAALS